MNDLLIEIGCEDLPARYVKPLSDALADGFVAGLQRRGIGHGDVRRFATPRRISVLLSAVAGHQVDQTVERLGPALAAALKDGLPTPAALGFAKSCGVEFSEIGQKDGKLHFTRKLAGRPTIDLIPEIFEESLKAMDELVPKRMRWGSGEETFVRPVRWLLALLGDAVVPLSRVGQRAGRVTYGHRFHAPAAIELAAPGDYEAALRRAYVWADFAGRRESVRAQVEARTAELGGLPNINEDLVDEVAALIEWPVVISGRFDEDFLQLPPEVIIATVETNQRYFTLFKNDAEGGSKSLEPYFITVSNIESHDVAQVVAGNERVIRPRLADALFFWDQDRRQNFHAFGPKLREVAYAKGLGTLEQKVNRVQDLALEVAMQLLPFQIGVDVNAAQTAAALCKNDLVTRMVYEFPELQGVMGGYYAELSGYSESIYRAIKEHYRPLQAGGPLPSSITGCVLALADKLDTLTGIFRIGQKPTASKDPFALRRTALGLLRICIHARLELDLRALLTTAWEAQPVTQDHGTSVQEVWSFIVERLKSFEVSEGATIEQFESVLQLNTGVPLDFHRRLQAVAISAPMHEFRVLTAAHKRARNLLRQVGVEREAIISIDYLLFESDVERELADRLNAMDETLAPLRSTRNYGAMLTELATLREPVDAFFAAVMVMADDPAVRANRVALLARLDALCREVADLSCLPG